MIERQARLDSLLEELGAEKGVLGAALISRDGLAVRATGRLAQSRETFHAMVATTMGAAEIAAAELNGGKPHHLIVTTDRLKIVIVGATRDLLLVLATQADHPHEALVPRLETVAQNVGIVVSGG